MTVCCYNNEIEYEAWVGVLKGGMGSAILEFMADNEYNPQVKRVGLPDLFVQHGSVKELYHICGMDEEGIYKILISF